MKELLQENGWLGVAFILTLHFVYVVWKDKNKGKDDELAQNTLAIRKLNRDLNRYFFGLKFLAGDQWPRISEFIQGDPGKDKDL